MEKNATESLTTNLATFQEQVRTVTELTKILSILVQHLPSPAATTTPTTMICLLPPVTLIPIMKLPPQARLERYCQKQKQKQKRRKKLRP